MADLIRTGGIHHLGLTVTDVQRSVAFYTSYLDFQVAVEFGAKVILSNGSLLLALAPPPAASQALPDDCFNENRVGLDHVSLSVSSRADLEAASASFVNAGIAHGEIKDLGPGFGIYVLAFRDPDNIQLELTAPYV
jgi:glyoxylase I family protein